MKVKIGGKIYDANEQPILLILDEHEKQFIENMGTQTMVCFFPENCETEEIEKFMGEIALANKETNKEHFFGDKLIADTIMLLTTQNHTIKECRVFRDVLMNMKPDQLKQWLNSPRDSSFIW